MGRQDAAALMASLRRVLDDDRVLAAMSRVPRERFVPRALRDRAYENAPLPIGGGQTISQPLVVARMCQLLDVRPGERVLDGGTGSGWHAALLAELGGEGVSIERDGALAAVAARTLEAAGVRGVELCVGDGFRGLPERAPYDAINVAAAAPPAAIDVLEGQLADGGRLVAPLADGDQRLVLTRRDGARVERRSLEPVRFVPLVRGVVP